MRDQGDQQCGIGYRWPRISGLQVHHRRQVYRYGHRGTDPVLLCHALGGAVAPAVGGAVAPAVGGAVAPAVGVAVAPTVGLAFAPAVDLAFTPAVAGAGAPAVGLAVAASVRLGVARRRVDSRARRAEVVRRLR